MLKRPGGSLVGRGAPTKSQLLPVISNWRQVIQKGYFLPAIVTVACVVGLFKIQNPIYYWWVLATYITLASYYLFIYLLCGKAKPWWVLAGTAIATMLILKSPLLNAFIFVFRDILPGDLPEAVPNGATPGFLRMFFAMFFGAGLMEELIKALPVLALFYIGMRLRSPWRERVGVWEPLDGILLGAASGIGFTLFETLGVYVPKMLNTVSASIGQQHGEAAGLFAGLYKGLELLIPRVMDSVAGHMAYSGYFGYFIGLSAMKPENRWQILGVGYLSAATIHALWNASDTVGTGLLIVVGVLTYALLAGGILKARQLSPSRAQNFATQVIGGGTAPQSHYSLQVSGKNVALYLGTYLLENDVPGLKAQGGNGLIGEVNANPRDPAILGLKNLSNRAWTITTAGRTSSVNSGQSTRLMPGAQIDFGPARGEIV